LDYMYTHEYTKGMAKDKKLQVPVTEQEISKYQAAARIYNIPTAEWARRILQKAADRDLSSTAFLDPVTALNKLKSLNAPVGDVTTMNEESVEGRLK
jgi:hypothetical protein